MKLLLKISDFILFFENDFQSTNLRNYFLRKLGFKIGSNVIIDRNLSFSDPTTIDIGNNVLIRQNCYLDHHIKISDYATLSMNVTIITAGHIPGSMEYIMKPVLIEDFVWIGANSLILPGVVVGKNSCVAAGSVVTKNVEPYTLVGGAPAKFIKEIEKVKIVHNAFGDIEVT